MEFTFKKGTYKAGVLPAMRQLHVGRRLAPVLEQLLLIDRSAYKSAMAGDSPVEGNWQQIIGPLVHAVSCLPDEDVEYIINTCLEVVEMKQPGGSWAPIHKNGVIMFPLDLPGMLLMTYHVIMENMAGFTEGLSSAFAGTGLMPSANG